MAILAQVAFTHQSGLAEDVFINTFHVLAAPTDANAQTIATNLIQFYNDPVAPSTAAIDTYLSEAISRVANAHKIRFYDTTVAGVGAFEEVPFSIGNNSSDLSLPAEVAICLSYKSGNATGAQGARQRGRIYLGPWIQDAAGTTLGRVRPQADLLEDILAAGVRLADNLQAAFPPNGGWVVHSTYGSAPGSNPPSLQTDYPITQLSVDNAFDTQRRRGEAPTVKTVVAV